MRLLPIAVALFVSAPAASAMTVSTFIAKADLLSAKGPLALFSGDYRVLKKELSDSMLALRMERLSALKSGAAPAYCPTQQSGSMSVDEVMATMHAVPPANRSRYSVQDALRMHLAKRFPCKH